MRTTKMYHELDENGEGKCSVPMFIYPGVPAGFCDKPAYGPPEPCQIFRYPNGRLRRADGRYNGYVPGLACYEHGGPKFRRHLGDPCKYCGIPHDDVPSGPCWGKKAEGE
jgi:hypothetical protein